MATADPPDLPLSLTKEGTSMEGTQESKTDAKTGSVSKEVLMRSGDSEGISEKARLEYLSLEDLNREGLKKVMKTGSDSTEVLIRSEELEGNISKVLNLGVKTEAQKAQKVPMKQGSWVGAVQGQKVLRKYEVEIEIKNGVGSVTVPDEITKDVAPLWDDFLIGKFLDEAPHIAKVHSIVNKIWTLNDRSQKIEVYEVSETMMKFRILNQADKNRILRRGMWNLAGVPVVMTKWSPVVEKEKPPTQSIPMWVHVKQVPLKMFSWQGLSFVTSPLGVPARLHPETAQCLNLEVAKVFVNVDLTKDLPKQLNFNVQGEDVLVEYSYPWLPKKCLKCGKWGHTEKICKAGGGIVREKQGDLEDGEIKEADNMENKPEERSEDDRQERSNTEKQEVRELELVTEEEQIEENKDSSKEEEKTPERKSNEEWAEVSPGKASRSPKALEFGQVSILTKSRFSVLTPVDEGEIPEFDLDKEVQCDEDILSVGDEVEKEENLVIPRQCLPRDSKLNHRYLRGGQKTQDVSPSNLNRKKPRRH